MKWGRCMIDLVRIMVDADGPVSYTHLDVYKRQVEHRSGVKEVRLPSSRGGRTFCAVR